MNAADPRAGRSGKKDVITEWAMAYLADGWTSDTLRASQDAGALFSDAVADRMAELEAGS